jgi:hypothetical protein
MASEKWFDKAHHGVMRGLCIVLVLGVCGLVKAEGIADFEDLTLGPESHWNGSDGSGGFDSGSARFSNYNGYGGFYWDGFAYSNMTDTASWGMDGQYNAITGYGQGGSANYAVGYIGWNSLPTMTLDEPTIVSGLYVTNNNYAYYAMLYGGDYSYGMANKFGDDDWFLLTIIGKDAAGVETRRFGFYLAEGTDIVNDWRYVDLTSLGVVKSVEFSLDSSDKTGAWLNTPAYFVIDTVVPEPATFVLMGFGVMGVIRRRKR